MLSFWFLTKLSHLLPLDVMLTKSVNIKSSANRHGRIPCFCSISLCSHYQFDLFVHADPYSPLNYPRIMFQEPPDTRRKTIADVLWNNCWPDGQNDDWGSKVVLLLKDPLHSWGPWLETPSPGAAGAGQPAAPGLPRPSARPPDSQVPEAAPPPEEWWCWLGSLQGSFWSLRHPWGLCSAVTVEHPHHHHVRSNSSALWSSLHEDPLVGPHGCSGSGPLPSLIQLPLRGCVNKFISGSLIPAHLGSLNRSWQVAWLGRSPRPCLGSPCSLTHSPLLKSSATMSI